MSHSRPNRCKLPSLMQSAGRGLFDQKHFVNASTRLLILLAGFALASARRNLVRARRPSGRKVEAHCTRESRLELTDHGSRFWVVGVGSVLGLFRVLFSIRALYPLPLRSRPKHFPGQISLRPPGYCSNRSRGSRMHRFHEARQCLRRIGDYRGTQFASLASLCWTYHLQLIAAPEYSKVAAEGLLS